MSAKKKTKTKQGDPSPGPFPNRLRFASAHREGESESLNSPSLFIGRGCPKGGGGSPAFPKKTAFAICRNEKDCKKFKGGVVTIGNFDGFHRGHRAVLNYVLKLAKVVKGPAVLITFDPHTQSVLASNGGLKVLTTTDEKCRLISETEADALLILKFNDRLKKMGAEAFLENIIFKYLAPKEVVFGHDHRFGAGRKGDFSLIRKVCEQKGVRTRRVRPLGFQGYTVSSTVIRELVALGRMEAASSLLGHPYLIRGKVERGYGQGRQLGFPTANIAVKEEKLLMPDGVYYGSLCIDKKRHGAVISLGVRPSFHLSGRALEVHVPGFSGNLYRKKVDLYVEGFIRKQKKYSRIDNLLKRIKQDIKILKHKHLKEDSLEDHS
ncbi:MAG: riboflavin biosynthesis protein RibF [Fibrobacteres bacterium]|nr:riboflavin biosynthesis protein RibF [Fibrobacterota bacterium]